MIEAVFKTQSDEDPYTDPSTGLSDPRPRAEIAKTLLVLDLNKDIARQSMSWVVRKQYENGSWEEVLPGYRNLQESVLATGIIGNLLLETQDQSVPGQDRAIEKAINFTLSREFAPGFFIKSLNHYADVLNVNAVCAAFLSTANRIGQDDRCKDARDRAIFNIVRHQFKDGAFPYATRERSFPYRWHLCVPDNHYHAITLYFLLVADPYLENTYLEVAVPRAMLWLIKSIGSKQINWSMCRHPFSVGLTGSYAYAAYCLGHMLLPEVYEKATSSLQKTGQELKPELLTKTREVVMSRLSELAGNGLLPRYEKPGAIQLIRGVLCDILDLGSSSTSAYPFRVKLRLAQNRVRRELIEDVKKESSLYFTAQALECLSRMSTEG